VNSLLNNFLQFSLNGIFIVLGVTIFFTIILFIAYIIQIVYIALNEKKYNISFFIPPLKNGDLCDGINCPFFNQEFIGQHGTCCNCKMGWALPSYNFESKPYKKDCPRYKNLKKEKNK